jgi:hypothetical protein
VRCKLGYLDSAISLVYSDAIDATDAIEDELLTSNGKMVYSIKSLLFSIQYLPLIYLAIAGSTLA